MTTTTAPVDLVAFERRLEALIAEAMSYGMSKALLDRMEAVRIVLVNIEREREKRS